MKNNDAFIFRVRERQVVPVMVCVYMCVQLSLTIYEHMDCSLTGSSVFDGKEVNKKFKTTSLESLRSKFKSPLCPILTVTQLSQLNLLIFSFFNYKKKTNRISK